VHDDDATDAVRSSGFATRQLHAGQYPDPVTGARAVPIYATSSYLFDSTEHAERLYAGEETGNRYARVENPTTQTFADRAAMLEGRPEGSAVALSSGQAATTVVMLSLARPGATWLVSDQLFGGTASVARKLLEPMGVTVKSVAPEVDAMTAVAGDDVVGMWVETIANPSGHVPDLPALAEVAHGMGAPLVVDNTWGAGGFLCRPFDHGADVIVHSATKWMGGHGVAIGGAVIDGGSFDWAVQPERFPVFARRDVHGRTLSDRAPDAPFAAQVVEAGLMTMGMTMAPHTAFLLLQGLETLDLRVQRACDNAMTLARALTNLDGIDAVVYPGLEAHPSHATARRMLHHGFGSVLGLRFTSEALARATIDRFRLVSHLANIGDAKTVAIHPWTTTHASLSEEAKRAGGVTPDFVRLSVGIETVEDILADVTRAVQDARIVSEHD